MRLGVAVDEVEGRAEVRRRPHACAQSRRVEVPPCPHSHHICITPTITLAPTVTLTPTLTRMQSFTSLEGFFSTLRAFEAADTTTCVPDLPSGFAPKRWRGYSTTLRICGDRCKDEDGFERDNLVGVTRRRGELYMVKHESTTSEEVSMTEGLAMFKRTTVTKRPRVVGVHEHKVDNGTHVYQWLQWQTQKYEVTPARRRLKPMARVQYVEGPDPWPLEPTSCDPPQQRGYTPARAKHAAYTLYVSASSCLLHSLFSHSASLSRPLAPTLLSSPRKPTYTWPR